VAVWIALAASPSQLLAQTAAELQAQGLADLSAGRFDDAVKNLDAAYRQKPSPGLLYNLGLAYKGMGFPGKALEALESYVKYGNPKTDQKTIASAKTEIDRIKNGYARFTLKLSPESASIDIDGKRATPEGNELWVATGQHTVSIRADGYERYEQTLDVQAGSFDLEVQLRQPSEPPPVRAAALLDEGDAMQKGGDLAGAIAKYRQAEEIFSTPRGAGSLGLAEEKVGEYPDAERHLMGAEVERKDPWVRKNRPKLRQALRRIQKQLASLEITGSPEGTEILVNGKHAGVLPIVGSVRVRATVELTVTAKKEGYASKEELLTLPARSSRKLDFQLEQAPVPVVVPVPVPEPVATEPLPVEPVPVAPIDTEPPPEPEQTAHSDIEAFSDPRDDLDGERAGRKDATGFEAALNFGFMPFIGGPDLSGSSSMLMGQILLGARPIWPLSFGIAINAAFDLSTEGTKLVAAGHPGLYVRGHVQRYKHQLAWDVWGGIGIQPLALQAAVLEPGALPAPETVDPSLVDQAGIARLIATQEAGVDRVHTLQTINLPLELGATLYFIESVGVDLMLGLTFWIPQQDCLHDGQDARFCTSDGVDSRTSFFIGGGFTFLP
jgi:tetratricopeptide (TPR) repeat protein